MSAPAMDLEAAPAASADTTLQPAEVRPRRRTYNHAIIDGLREALAATQAQLRDTLDALDQCNAENVELRQAVANQRETVQLAYDTAEHAYQGRRPDQVVGSQHAVAVCLVAGSAIVAWELLAHLVAAVTR